MAGPAPPARLRVGPGLFVATAWLYLAGIVVQVSLAGAGLFELTDWTLHTELGWGLGGAVVLVLVSALIARTRGRTLWLTIALAVSGFVQPSLAEVRAEAPLVAALHPVNALILFWLAWLVAERALALARGAPARVPPTPVTAAPTATSRAPADALAPPANASAPAASAPARDAVADVDFPDSTGPASLEGGSGPVV